MHDRVVNRVPHKYIMGRAIALGLLGCIASVLAAGYADPVVFVGTTPCGPGVRPFHGISSDSKCALVKWHLTLLEAAGGRPATYTLKAIYGFIDYDTNLIRLKGTNVFEGQWQIQSGIPSNPGAVVYELVSEKPGISLRLMKMDGNILQVLTTNGHLMIGDEFQSYTLNREPRKNLNAL